MSEWKQVQLERQARCRAQVHLGATFTAAWQRATDENTNGLLRQSFPKGTNLSVHSAADLDRAAAELDDRPRARLGFARPIEQIGPLLSRRPSESAVLLAAPAPPG